MRVCGPCGAPPLLPPSATATPSRRWPALHHWAPPWLRPLRRSHGHLLPPSRPPSPRLVVLFPPSDLGPCAATTTFPFGCGCGSTARRSGRWDRLALEPGLGGPDGANRLAPRRCRQGPPPTLALDREPPLAAKVVAATSLSCRAPASGRPRWSPVVSAPPPRCFDGRSFLVADHSSLDGFVSAAATRRWPLPATAPPPTSGDDLGTCSSSRAGAASTPAVLLP
jgi:hypothetical protein